MKIKLLIILTFVLLMGTISFAQDAPKNTNPFPFAQYNEPSLSLVNQISNPNGYNRLPSKKLTLYQHWLTNMPLKPKGTPSTNWKGKKISKADTLNRIVDIDVNSKYITDADIPVLLLLHFFRMQGNVDEFNVRLKKQLSVNYKKWRQGEYIDEKGKDIYYKPSGMSRADTDEEFLMFLDFITKYFDTKSLRLNVEHTDSRVFKPSHMLIQYKEDDPDSVGHVSVILDAAVNDDYEARKMLIAYGGNPAQSVVVPNNPYDTGNKWFTLDEIREHLLEYGMGYVYRWVN
ncbi:MAG: DUF4846 domain-containing protein [candidate division Zixibacteria bacterium]|nr:DUF4846 domain-containing protein [candidate division Zixibacteria bacterium]